MSGIYLIVKMALNQGQKVALNIVASGHNLCICGQAGTGKTHTITEIVRVCREKGSVVAVTATTGIASTQFPNNFKAMTIHR